MTRPHRELGDRLKRVRAHNGLSQRLLAKRSGVANATISQIESGVISPTVGTLKKILDGVPISLAEFFTFDARGESEKIFFAAKDLVEIADGGISYRLVGGNLTDRVIQLVKERYEPGTRTGRHALRHEGEECGLILSGQLKVTVGKETRILKAGEAYYFNSTIPHSFENTSSEPCELVSACSPPSF